MADDTTGSMERMVMQCLCYIALTVFLNRLIDIVTTGYDLKIRYSGSNSSLSWNVYDK